MAKKNRKTRKEKEVLKTHQFNPWITPKRAVSSSHKKADEPVSAEDRNKPKIPDYVMTDFKKITAIMGSFILIVIILAVLSYYTDLFNSFFNIFHIKY